MCVLALIKVTLFMAIIMAVVWIMWMSLYLTIMWAVYSVKEVKSGISGI